MRVLVMFDLPVVTALNRRNYCQFRKFLIKDGFFMLQESIYCKLVPNSTSAELLTERIKNNKPPEGLVHILRITEKQYSKMECLIGEEKKEVLDTDERLVIL